MFNKIYLALAVVISTSLSLFSQSTISATYSAGNTSTDFGNITNTSVNSSCPTILNVPVPVGQYVTAVSVEYSIEALGFNWRTEQISYLECVTTNTKEAAVTNGPSGVNSPGIQAYARTGLNIANGVVPIGGLQFKLHAFRTFTGGGCTQTAQRVLNNTFKITVSYGPPPTCPPPTNLQVNSTSSSSVGLSWVTGGATNWQIEYGSVGFTLGTGTKISASSNPFTVSGLSPNTQYEFYVRDSCSGTNQSFWLGGVIAQTTCAPVNAPYNENFDGVVWNRGASTAALGTINTCWNRDVLNYVFKSGPPQFVSTQTGASIDHTLGTAAGKYLQAERILFSGMADSATILSVPINLAPLTVPELSFWYHMFGSDIDKLTVYVSNNGGSSFTQVYQLSGQAQSSNTDAWKEAVVSLAAFANDTVIVKFSATHINFGFNADIGIDDLSIHEQPSCPKPQLLSVIGQTSNSVSLSWTSGGASNWQVEYGPVGFVLGAGTKVNVSTNPATIGGLSASTTYDFYVRDSCGASVSSWIGLVRATTSCVPVVAPYSETFDGTTFTIGTFTVPGNLDPCWYKDGTLNYQMVPMSNVTSFSTGPSADHTSGTGKFLVGQRFFGTLSPSTTAILESPLIDLNPLTIPELTFWYHSFGLDIDSLRVEVFDGSTWKRENAVVGQQQNSKTAAWKELVVDISSYANDTIRVKFIAYRNSTFAFNSAIAIDDFDVHEQPACPKPSNLSATAVTASSVTLSWTSGGSSNWNIEYGVSGFTPGTGTKVNAATNPFTVTGLSASTNYQFYVRDSCSTANSVWVGPISKSTACLPIQAPYDENFDGLPWVKGVTFNDTGSISSCWNRYPMANYIWVPGPPPFTTTLTGPSADHTTGTGKFMFTESIFTGGTPPFDGYLESPLIDLSTLVIPELTFWYHMYGSAIGTLLVEVDNGGGYTSVLTKNGQQHTSNSDPWKEAVVSLAAYAGDTVRIRFKASKASFNTLADVAIDDVDIHEQPSCPKPQNLAVNGQTSNSVTLGWTSGGASNWQIEYGPIGFALGSGTLVNASTNPFSVTGLSANTSYDFYVRDSCGVADVSAWLGPINSRTGCSPIAAPYFENFDGSNFTIGTITVPGNLDPCWSRDTTLNYQIVPLQTVTTFSTGPTADHTTGIDKFLVAQRFFGSLSQSTLATLESPLIDLSPLTIPELTFWYHSFGADIDSMKVEVYDGLAWSREASIVGQTQVSKSDAWKELKVDLSSYANDTIKVRFTAYRNSTFAFNSAIAIDDFDIHEQPSCPKPSGLAVSGSTGTSINLSWISGGASNWQIEYGPSGFTLGTGTIVSAGTNPFNLTGLNPSTSYDFYVRDSCGATDVSDWFGPESGTTLCLVTPAPFYENFDGGAWTPGVTFNDLGSISPCWTRTPLVDYIWVPGPPAFSSNFTGPSGDHTTGNGKYIFAESVFNGGTAPFNTFIETPLIDLSPLTTPELTFWYHMFGSGIGSIRVEIDNGSGYTVLFTKSGQQQTTGSQAWKEAIISLAAYANDTIKLRFKATKASFSTLADAAIDDVDIHEEPSCPKPDAINVTASTTSSITVGWTSGGASNWLVGYRPSGTGMPLTIVATSTNPFVITGLNPSTSYEIFVKDSCAVGDVSVWVGPGSGSTDCGVAIAPWGENFDGSTWVSGFGIANTNNQINSCWSRPSSANPNFGSRTGPSGGFGSGPSKDASGSGGYIYTAAFNAPGAGRIVSPWIYIPPNMTNPKLYFSYHMFGNSITSLTMRIDDGGGLGPNVVNITGQQQSSKNAAWRRDSVDLSPFAGDTISFRFIGTTTGFNGEIAIDEISISSSSVAAPCLDPHSVSFTAKTPTGFTINWTGNGQTQVEVVPAGQAQGTGTLYPPSSSPLVVTGLLSNTSYNVYLRDSCGQSYFSAWVADSSSTLPCPAVTTTFNYTRSWLSASFNSTGTSNADSLHWDFGNGSSSSVQNPTNVYAGAGTYIVELIGYSNCGSLASFVDTIVICDTLSADFNYVVTGSSVSFDGTSSNNATNYHWDFGNGADTTGAMVTYSFPSSGTKTVTLTVYNECGDSAKISKNIKICLPAVAKWTYNIISTTSAGMNVQFDGSATQNATSYEWDFGDGSAKVTGQVMPTHLYLTPGLFYSVTLKVTNSCGEISTSKLKLSQMVGLLEYDESHWQIFPNPVSSQLQVKWDAQKINPEAIHVYSISGALMNTYILEKNTGEYSINMKEYVDNSYVILIEYQGGFFKKIIQKQ